MSLQIMGLQIVGKGGFAREVAAGLAWGFKWGEYDELKDFSKDHPTVIAIGDPKVRRNLVEQYPDFKYTHLLFGKSMSQSNIFGKGTIICYGTIVTVDVTIGDHVIVNLNCTIGHDCKIGNFVTISPGANISGNVEIGDGCYIGSNAVIREGVKICANTIVGAGAIVVKDITEAGTYIGTPTKSLQQYYLNKLQNIL